MTSWGLSKLWRHVRSALLLTPTPLLCWHIRKCDTFLYIICLWSIFFDDDANKSPDARKRRVEKRPSDMLLDLTVFTTKFDVIMYNQQQQQQWRRRQWRRRQCIGRSQINEFLTRQDKEIKKDITSNYRTVDSKIWTNWFVFVIWQSMCRQITSVTRLGSVKKFWANFFSSK